MFKKLLPLAIIATAVVSTGCASRNAKQFSSPLDPGHVRSHQLEADIAVGGKISGESTATTLFGLITLGDNKFADGVDYTVSGGGFSGFSIGGATASVKSAAAYDAVTKSSSDIIIAPRYVIDVQDYFIWKEVHATVSGYKGTITKIQQRKLDTKLIIQD